MMKQVTQFAQHYWQWIITSTIALYAASLTTYNVLAARKRDQRKVKVAVSWGAPTYGDQLGEPTIFLTASNPGHHPVTLVAAGFNLPNKKQLALLQPDGTVRLPYELKAGQNCILWITVKEMAERLHSAGCSGKVHIVGFYRDATDKVHLADPFPIDVSEWC
jgi:hypothetical protein